MIIEQKPALTEDQLNNFISERESEIRDGKNNVVAKLQKKASRMCKQETNTKEEKEDLERKANCFTKVAMFLRKYPPEKLMAMALLDRKSLTQVYNSPLSKIKQRALFHFASHENVKTLILKFRKQHPNWKKAKGLLLSEMKQNNNQVFSELTNTIETDENGNKSQKIKKKKGVKKSLKRKKEMNEDGSGKNESCEMPRSKKVKVSSDNNLSQTEEMINSTRGEEEEKIGVPKYTPKHIKKKQKKMKKKQMKKSPIEKMLHNGSTNPVVSTSSPTGTIESMVEAKPSLVQQSPSKTWQEGKFHKKSNKKQGLNNGSKNWKANYSSQIFRSQPMWKIKKAGGKDNANMIVSPDGKDKFTSPKKDDGEKQDKSTSPKKDDGEKQDKSTSPKKDDGEKPSLLRPAWLTNPDEKACNVQSGRPAPAFDRGRGRSGPGGNRGRGRSGPGGNRGRGRSGPGGNRGRGRPGPPGNRGFQRKESSNANMIRVSDDWKSKCTEPKTEDTKTTSLLRPSWLINPQENKPPPSFKKFRGNFRGKNKY